MNSFFNTRMRREHRSFCVFLTLSANSGQTPSQGFGSFHIPIVELSGVCVLLYTGIGNLEELLGELLEESIFCSTIELQTSKLTVSKKGIEPIFRKHIIRSTTL